MSFLEAVGRAQPVQAIQNFQLNNQNIEASKQQMLASQKQMAVQDLSMKKINQDMQIQQNQMELAKKQQAAKDKPVDLTPFALSALGGPEGKPFQTLMTYAKNMGIVDTTTGGFGTMRAEDLVKMMNGVDVPDEVTTQVNLATIDHYRNEVSTLFSELQKKPDDPKLLAALESANTGLQTAQFKNKEYADYLKSQKQEKEEAKQFTLGEGQTRFDAEGNPIASVPKTESGVESQTKIRQVQKDLDQLQGQRFRIVSQEDFMDAVKSNPAVAEWMATNGLSQPTKQARDLYLKYLDTRIAETKGMLSGYGVTYQDEPANQGPPQAEYVWNPETMTYEENAQ